MTAADLEIQLKEVDGTCGSVNAMALSQNLKELQVLGSKHDTIRKGLVYELLSAQESSSVQDQRRPRLRVGRGAPARRTRPPWHQVLTPQIR